MRYFLPSLVGLVLLTVGHTAVGQEPIGRAIMVSGDTIPFYKNAMVFSDVINYDTDNKNELIHAKDVQVVYMGNQRYIPIRMWSGSVEFHRVVMFNEKYMLTVHALSMGLAFSVYESSTQKRIKTEDHSIFAKADLKKLDKYIVPYFGDCTEAIETIRNGISKEQYEELGYRHDKMFRAVSDFDCTKSGTGK